MLKGGGKNMESRMHKLIEKIRMEFYQEKVNTKPKKTTSWNEYKEKNRTKKECLEIVRT